MNISEQFGAHIHLFDLLVIMKMVLKRKKFKVKS